MWSDYTVESFNSFVSVHAHSTITLGMCFYSSNPLQYNIDFNIFYRMSCKNVHSFIIVLFLHYTLAPFFLYRQRNCALPCCIIPPIWLSPPTVCRLTPCIRWAWWRQTSTLSSFGLLWRCSLRKNSADSSNLRATKSEYPSPAPAKTGDRTLPTFPHIPWRSPLLMELQARCKPGADWNWQKGGYDSTITIV